MFEVKTKMFKSKDKTKPENNQIMLICNDSNCKSTRLKYYGKRKDIDKEGEGMFKIYRCMQCGKFSKKRIE
jgi:hypothetical protein